MNSSSSHRVRVRRRRSVFRRYRAPVLALVLGGASLLGWLWVTGDTPPPPVTSAPLSAAVPLVSLPADDAPHQNATEWWYYSGQLRTQSGERFGYHVAVFLRRALSDHTMFNLSLVNLETGRHYAAQARTAGVPRGAGGGFDFRYQGWQVVGEGGRHALDIAGEGFRLALDMNDTNPPTLHREPGVEGPGLLDFREGGKSYYYSRTRMPSRGTLTLDGKVLQVVGDSWFDHQWGDFVSTDVGWNWFALQFDDGADLMLFHVFDPSGKRLMQAGTWVEKGQVTPLGAEDFVLRETGTRWVSRKTGIAYPLRWQVSIPRLGREFTLRPYVEASEFDGLASILKIYWEGPVAAEGKHPGKGYMELSGYTPVKRAAP